MSDLASLGPYDTHFPQSMNQTLGGAQYQCFEFPSSVYFRIVWQYVNHGVMVSLVTSSFTLPCHPLFSIFSYSTFAQKGHNTKIIKWAHNNLIEILPFGLPYFFSKYYSFKNFIIITATRLKIRRLAWKSVSNIWLNTRFYLETLFPKLFNTSFKKQTSAWLLFFPYLKHESSLDTSFRNY